jgi:hypothetical protein
MNDRFDLQGAESWTAKEIAQRREALRREGRILADVVSTKDVTGEQLQRMQMINDKLEVIDKIYDQRRQMESRVPAPHVPFPDAVKSDGFGNYASAYSESLGRTFVDSTPYRTTSGNRPQFSVDLGVGSIQNALKATATTSTVSPDPRRTSALGLVGTQPTNLLDFIPIEEVRGGSLDYLRESSFTNSALTVDENSVKPEATLGLSSVPIVPKMVAVHVPVTRQVLQDVGAAESYVDQRLRTMVRMKSEQQVLAGSGGGAPAQVRGFLSTVGIQTEAKAANPDTNLLAIGRAINKVRTIGFAEPNAVVLHPTNYMSIQQSTSALSGDFLYQAPSVSGPGTIWGVPVVLSTTITLNTGLVGAFAEFSKIYAVGGLTVEVGFIANDFTTNLRRFLCEWRLDLAVMRPNAFCSVTALT